MIRLDATSLLKINAAQKWRGIYVELGDLEDSGISEWELRGTEHQVLGLPEKAAKPCLGCLCFYLLLLGFPPLPRAQSGL